jgi:hypothetical protein
MDFKKHSKYCNTGGIACGCEGYEFIAVLTIGILCGKLATLAQRDQGCTLKGVRKTSRCIALCAATPVKRSIKLPGR